LGLAVGAQGRHDEAVDAFERSLKIQPAHPRTWQAYGAALVNVGRHAEGARAWRRCIELSPADSAVLWRGLGEAELLAGNLDAALEALRKAHGLHPEDPSSLFLLGQSLLRAGRAQEAVRLLQEERAARPRHRTLDMLLGQALLRLGQGRLRDGAPEEAVDLAEQAVELGSLPPDGLFLAALLADRAGRRDRAHRWFEAALAAEPELLRRKHEAALALEGEQRYAEAASMLRDILAADPDHAPTLFNLGRLLLLDGRPDQAIPPLRRGLELREDPRARAALDQALREAGAEDR
jgi:tetratricopeptide (TPR) repeat protein